MSRRMALKGFKGCVGSIDSMTFPLLQKPAVDGECYFDLKQRYSVNAQVVCDDCRRIIAFYAGWPGSCSDNTVYREMLLSKTSYKPHFFCPGQYVIGDSVYPADKVRNTLVPAYRSNMKGLDNEAFSACLAHAHVANEYTIGVLKARWASLKELRVQIKCAEDMKHILMWTVACVTFHNMLINIGDLWPDDGEIDEESSEDERLHEVDICNNDAKNDDDVFPFRKRVKASAIERRRQHGGIIWLCGW